MMAFCRTLLDRITFTVLTVIAMQLPSFILQYTQRLAGHLDEAKYQLSKYQYIADQHYQGDILLLVKRYQMNSDPGIAAAGDIVYSLIDRISMLSQSLADLNQQQYISKVYSFITNMDTSMAKATLQDYQLTIPLNIESLATGLIFALGVSYIISLIFSQTNKGISAILSGKH